jgi:CDP-L-myo-inositol myo-inositolphosphotransferase
VTGDTAGQTGRCAVVRFPSAEVAARRVAGVTIAGRVLRELGLAGFTRVEVLIEDGEPLAPQCRLDAMRLAPAMTLLECGDPDEQTDEVPSARSAPVLSLAGVWLPPKGSIREFMASGRDTMAHAGQIYAQLSRVSGHIGPDNIYDPGAALRLDAPGAAMTILRGTVKPLDGPVSRMINRPISRRMSHLLLRFPGSRPSQATVGTAILAAVMFAALVIGPGVWGLALGGFLYQFASVFDGVDGEMARATFRSSKSGAMLDSLIDAATNLLFILGLVIHAQYYGPSWAFYAGIWVLLMLPVGLAIIGTHAMRTGGALSFDLLKEGRMDPVSSGGGARIIQVLTFLACRDVYALIFSALAVAGQAALILSAYAVAITLWLVVILATVVVPARSERQWTRSASR